MLPGPDRLEPAWEDALERAARLLPPDDPVAQIFYEEREDLRIDLHPDTAAIVVPTRLRGLRTRRSGTHPSSVFMANPAPGDAISILDEESEPEAPGSPKCNEMPHSVRRFLDPRPLTAWLEDLRRQAESGASKVRFSARWVGFRQLVAVVGPDGKVATDLRRGARLRLEARLRSGGAANAVMERVFRPPDLRAGLEQAVNALIERAEARRDARPAVPGETMIVMAPGVGGILVHELVGHALEADTVLRGASWLARVESEVAPSGVTVLDDPRRGRGAWKCDDEGVECGATSLVEAGRVVGALQDRTTASLTGKKPTGHGRRSSFREPVRPRMGCTFLAPGGLDPEEIVEGTASGIYVRRMAAASTDARSGMARFVVTDADCIDQGRLGQPLDSFLLELRASTALPGLDRVGNDLDFDTCVGSCLRDGQPLATSVGGPTFRIGVARVAP